MKYASLILSAILLFGLCGCGAPPKVTFPGEIAFWDGDVKLNGASDDRGLSVRSRVLYSQGDSEDFNYTLPPALGGYDTMIVELSARNLSEKDSFCGLLMSINEREIMAETKLPSRQSGKFMPVRLFVPLDIAGQPGAKSAFQIKTRAVRNERGLAVDNVRVYLVKLENGLRNIPGDAELQALAKRFSSESLEERAAALEVAQALDEPGIARLISFADPKNPLVAWCIDQLKNPENRALKLTASKHFQRSEMLLEDEPWAVTLCGVKDSGGGDMARSNLIVKAKDEQEARTLVDRLQIPGFASARPELYILPDLLQTEPGFKLYRLEALRGFAIEPFENDFE